MLSSVKVAARRGIRLVQSARNGSSLKETLAAQIPGKQEEMKKLKKEYGNYSLGDVTVDQAIGGGRDVKCMYYETSLLDAQEVMSRPAVISYLSYIHPVSNPAGYSLPWAQYP